MNDEVRGTASQSQYLTIHLDTEEYGIDILSVREIRGWTPVTRIPQSPHFVLGVFNLRGSIVPVIDMRLRFGQPRKDHDATTVMIVVTVNERLFGVVVDSVSDVIDVDSRALRPVPDMSTTVDTEYLKGLTSIGERMILLLDADRLLQPRDAQLLETALQAADDIQAVA